MAGDWIKLQKDTPDKPEVLAMATRLGIDPDAVVGKLVRVWSWFDTHTINGNASCVTYSFLDRLTGVTGFAEQMNLVGWLDQQGHDLALPNFGYHNGETAKRRALGKNRTEKHRSGNAEGNAEGNASNVTKTSPEKRREEVIPPKSPKGESVVLPDWMPLDAWEGFSEMRNRIKKPMTHRAKGLIVASLGKMRERGIDVKDVLDASTRNGWQDVYEPKVVSGRGNPAFGNGVAL